MNSTMLEQKWYVPQGYEDPVDEKLYRDHQPAFSVRNSSQSSPARFSGRRSAAQTGLNAHGANHGNAADRWSAHANVAAQPQIVYPPDCRLVPQMRESWRDSSQTTPSGYSNGKLRPDSTSTAQTHRKPASWKEKPISPQPHTRSCWEALVSLFRFSKKKKHPRKTERNCVPPLAQTLPTSQYPNPLGEHPPSMLPPPSAAHLPRHTLPRRSLNVFTLAPKSVESLASSAHQLAVPPVPERRPIMDRERPVSRQSTRRFSSSSVYETAESGRTTPLVSPMEDHYQQMNFTPISLYDNRYQSRPVSQISSSSEEEYYLSSPMSRRSSMTDLTTHNTRDDCITEDVPDSPESAVRRYTATIPHLSLDIPSGDFDRYSVMFAKPLSGKRDSQARNSRASHHLRDKHRASTASSFMRLNRVDSILFVPEEEDEESERDHLSTATTSVRTSSLPPALNQYAKRPSPRQLRSRDRLAPSSTLADSSHRNSWITSIPENEPATFSWLAEPPPAPLKFTKRLRAAPRDSLAPVIDRSEKKKKKKKKAGEKIDDDFPWLDEEPPTLHRAKRGVVVARDSVAGRGERIQTKYTSGGDGGATS